MKTEMSSEKCVIGITNCISNLRRIMPCSTTAVQEAVNFKVTGSNPVGAARVNSSEVEHLLYTEAVGGSIPSSPINKKKKQ